MNGRAGRRVACVLSGDGMAVEVLDMEGGPGGEDSDENEQGGEQSQAEDFSGEISMHEE